MASVKSTFTFLLVLIVLGGLAVGGAFLYQTLQARGLERDLAQAEQFLNEGQPAPAEQLLIARLDEAKPTSPWAPRALALRLRALEQLSEANGTGGVDPALTTLAARIIDPERPWVRPGDEAWARAHLMLGQAALAQNQAQQATPHFESVLSQSQKIQQPLLDQATLGIARIELATGQVEQGRDRLAALEATLPSDSPIRPRVEDVLGKVNSMMLLSQQPFGEDQIHILEKGDNIDKLSRKYNVSSDLLMGVNQISDPRKLRIGRRIKIPHLDFSIVVNKSDNTLTLYNFGKFFKKYQVRTGKADYMTPVGNYEITNKAKDPQWYSHQLQENIPPGDPRNELGVRWLGFQGTSLGLHEAIDPTTIGTYSSNGCVGLRQEDVIELFNLIPIGTPLKIEGNINPNLIAQNTGPSGIAMSVAPGSSPAGSGPASSALIVPMNPQSGEPVQPENLAPPREGDLPAVQLPAS